MTSLSPEKKAERYVESELFHFYREDTFPVPRHSWHNTPDARRDRTLYWCQNPYKLGTIMHLVYVPIAPSEATKENITMVKTYLKQLWTQQCLHFYYIHHVHRLPFFPLPSQSYFNLSMMVQKSWYVFLSNYSCTTRHFHIIPLFIQPNTLRISSSCYHIPESDLG